MAQLDRFLSALSEYQAEALILEQDRAPAFRFLSGTKTVSKAMLDADKILALVTELADPNVIDTYREDGTASFVYSVGALTYTGVLEDDQGTMVATIWETAKNGSGDATDASFADVAQEIARETPPPEADSAAVAAVPPDEYQPDGGGSGPSAPSGSWHEMSAEDADAATAVADAVTSTNGVPRFDPSSLPSLDDHQTDLLVPDDLPPNYRALIDELLRATVEKQASDLHLCCEQPPVYRVDGHVELDGEREPLEADELFRMLFAITPQRNRDQFLKHHDTDFAYAIEGVSRFRANLYFDRRGPAAVFRAIPDDIVPADELGLSKEVRELALLNKGLVLVTGPTGSGKSTTIASLIDLVNEQRREHIITIEDPVEFVHPNKQCLVNQRQVGVHTDSFKSALRAALREDPDVILVGELRDLETMEMAIETAETGHLVFGTLHTTTACSTVDRIIDQFPADRQAQIRVMLSESLRGVISQTLVPRKGGGRVAAHEILLMNSSISNLIREGKTFQIESQLQTGKKQGMRTLNDDLLRLIQEDLVDAHDAYLKAVDKKSFRELCERNGIDAG